MPNNRPVIQRIELKNFKCHSFFKEDLTNLTILAGENSAGKSSIIQALLMYNAAVKSYDNSVFTLNVCGINLGNAAGIITESSGSDYIDITLKTKDGPGFLRLSAAEDNDVSFKVTEMDEEVRYFRLYYINAERLGPRAYNNIDSPNPFYVGTHGENTVYIINQLDSIVRKPEFKYIKRTALWKRFSDDSRFYAVVEDCLQRIIPGTKLKVKTNPEQGTSAIRYSNGYGVDVIPTATGFGITYVLPIIVQALISLLYPNSVLIVENPEAHLHPYSQSQMGRFLADISRCGVQVIIETHSEHIINGCRLKLAELNRSDTGSILFFNRDRQTLENQHTLIRIDSAGELSAWPEGFFDQSENDLYEVVKNKCRK